jgi:hypothetical protein
MDNDYGYHELGSMKTDELSNLVLISKAEKDTIHSLGCLSYKIRARACMDFFSLFLFPSFSSSSFLLLLFFCFRACHTINLLALPDAENLLDTFRLDVWAQLIQRLVFR